MVSCHRRHHQSVASVLEHMRKAHDIHTQRGGVGMRADRSNKSLTNWAWLALLLRVQLPDYHLSYLVNREQVPPKLKQNVKQI